ncbi:MAG: hypothetical protein PHI35_00625 [Victivallaceae bacterium]|nr:hypothetical protein [Victivallaceae bacterium]
MQKATTPKQSKPATAPGVGPGGFTPEELRALVPTGGGDRDKTPSAVLAAWCPPINTAGAFELKPYTAQHRLILESAGSPFVKPNAKENEEITYAEIAAAIYTLGQTGEALYDAGPLPPAELSRRFAVILQKIPGCDSGLAVIRREICRHLASSTVTIINPGDAPKDTAGPLVASLAEEARQWTPAAAGS